MKKHDNHIHIAFDKELDYGISMLKNIIKLNGYSGVSVLSIPFTDHHEGGYNPVQNCECLYYRDNLPGENYAMAGFDAHSDDPRFYIEYAKHAVALGYDGFKILEGIPSLRKNLDKRLCDKSFDLFYEYVQENNLPIVWHLGNPAFSWDEAEAEKRNIAKSRIYDKTFPTLEELYDESLEVLKKFPQLRVTFAHFYFMSDNHDRLCNLFDKYKNVSVDLTPGGEMYTAFSADTKLWHEFFTKYSDRIIYGTDTYNVDIGWRERSTLAGGFIEKTEPFESYMGIINPCGISDKCKENIFYNNAQSLFGGHKKTDIELLKHDARTVLEGGRALNEVRINNLKKIIES